MQLRIRRARVDDLETLDRIALAAKAHWGYTAAQLALWHPALLTSELSLRTCPTFVADIARHPVGYAQLDPTHAPWELVALWVLPESMRQGIGRRLLDAACRCALAAGQSELAIDADPHAAPFYLACGARCVGHVAAPIAGEPHRTRPQFALATMPQAGR